MEFKLIIPFHVHYFEFREDPSPNLSFAVTMLEVFHDLILF